MHVHVQSADGACKFWLEPIIALADVRLLSIQDLTRIERIVEEHREEFVPFADYPVLRTTSVAQICAVARIAPDQLSWPALDIDIDLRALEYPETFPLIFN